MGDVGERPAVHEGGRALERLDEVGLERVFEQRRHGTVGLEVARGDRLVVVGVADDDAREALLEVVDGSRQAEDRHDLGGDGDLEVVLARNALLRAAQAVDQVAELAIVHVDAALPRDLLGVDSELVALLDVVVEHGGEQVVCRADGMKVAGEVQVDVLHRDDLRVPASGSAALDAEDRPERRLAKRHHDVLAKLRQAVCQADGGRGLALTGGRRVDGGDEDELAGSVLALQDVVVDLCLVLAVLLDIVEIDPDPLGNLGNRLGGN